MQQYLDHAKRILTDEDSAYKPNRTDVDSISLFGEREKYRRVSEQFPLLTTKKLNWKWIAHELTWFMRGGTNLEYLRKEGCPIWDEWGLQRYLKSTGTSIKPGTQEWDAAMKEYQQRIDADPEFARMHGELGPVYGAQWRHWLTPEGKVIDQFGDAVNRLKKSPSSRRHIVTAWNPAEVDQMALPPCHTFYQMNVRGDTLDLQLYQRSADMFLGVPYNIASYAALLTVLAKEASLKPGSFIHVFGDSHFYCGSGERGAWYGNNLDELKDRVGFAARKEERSALEGIIDRSGYRDVKEWIEAHAPPETPGREREDQVPLILTQLSRDPRTAPKLEVAYKHYDELTWKDFDLKQYDPHPFIRGKVAV